MSYKSSYTGAQIDAGIAAANTAVQPSRTVNGHALSADVAVTASDVGLGNVTNESKATMFSTPTFTGNAALSDGNFVVGTSGKGIDFSATGDASGMTSELLNDYEEGTWTASLNATGTAPTTPITSTGKYTKIGRQVTVTFGLSGDLTGASGVVFVGGLPFAMASGNNYFSALLTVNLGSNAAMAYGIGGNSYFALVTQIGFNYIAVSAGAGRDVHGTFTYFV